MGLHPSEIISGYTKAINKTVELLDELVEKGSETMDVRNKDEVASPIKAAVASKQFGQEGILCHLIADACIQVCPKNPANFNVDNVRVAKLLGGGLHNCTIVRGMVLKNDAIGSIKRMEKAKIAVFAGGVETSATETKGTVLIHGAEQIFRNCSIGLSSMTASNEGIQLCIFDLRTGQHEGQEIDKILFFSVLFQCSYL